MHRNFGLSQKKAPYALPVYHHNGGEIIRYRFSLAKIVGLA